jgi:hypothetical protein
MVERVLSKADEIGSKLAVGKSVLAVSTFFTDADPDLNGIILLNSNPRESRIVKNNFPLHADENMLDSLGTFKKYLSIPAAFCCAMHTVQFCREKIFIFQQFSWLLL